MKKNSSNTSQKRTSKKFNTTIKKSGPTISNKLKSSTSQSKNPIPIPSKGRKSAIIPTTKMKDRKKSLTTKVNNLTKGGKKSSASLFKENNTLNKSKKMSIKGRKSIKKTSLGESQNKNQQNDKDNILTSEVFNKNIFLGINTVNSENNTNAVGSEEESKINDLRSKNNPENEKINSMSSRNEIKEESKNQSKKNSLKENNNELKNSKVKKDLFDYNRYININLIKETNEKPNYRYDTKLDNNFDNQEGRLRNYKVESSDYISEKNKYLMKNLLYLLDKKPDDKKGSKNFFRSSINVMNNKEKNKMLEMLDKTKNDIFRIKNDEKLNHIDAKFADKKMSEIYRNLFEQNHSRNVFRSFDNNLQAPYYKEKYFFNYVDGLHPNMFMLLRNNRQNANIQQFIPNKEKKYNIIGRNELVVDKRDNRYLKYSYDYMMNTIDNKLNRDYRQIYRRKRMQQMFDNINEDIYEMNPYQENIFRKTFSEIKRNSLYL